MKNRSYKVRSVAAAAIMGLSLSTAALGAPAAFAQAETDGTTATSIDKANIDFSKTGSITLYKKLGEPSTTNATGNEMADVPGAALQGVEFTITKVNADLATADWTKLPKTAAEAKGNLDSNTTFTQTTDGEGKVDFTDLPLGLYYVEETKTPDGIVASAPFLVSVPMTNTDGDAWDYDIVAYPKNSQVTAEKTVDDANKNVGDTVTYTLSLPIPKVAEGESITKYVITDDYDEAHSTVDLSNLVVKAGDTIIPSTAYTASNAEGKVTIAFTDFAALTAAQGGTVTVTLPATLTASGDVKNTATVTFNNPNGSGETTTTTNDVHTYTGKVTVTKTDETEATKVLEGAEFEIYRAGTDGKCGTTDDGDAVKAGLKTDANGQITVDGLHVTNLQNSVSTIADQYCLKETKAPAGYVTPTGDAAWNPFTINVVETKDASGKVTTAEITNATVSVTNHKSTTPNLPLTGGAGVGILAALGAAIVALGAWFARRSAKN